VLTRKSLGGIQTDLDCRALDASGTFTLVLVGEKSVRTTRPSGRSRNRTGRRGS